MRENKGIRMIAALLCLAVLCAAGAAGADQEPEVPHDRCTERAIVFLYYWSTEDACGAEPLCLPAWTETPEETRSPLQELWRFLAVRRPVQFRIEAVHEDGENARTLEIWAVMRHASGMRSESNFSLAMVRENDEWYVDPRSLAGIGAESTPIITSVLPTQPPTPPVNRDPDMVLYYNPQGGTRYHTDPNCMSISNKYLPLQAAFTYSQVNDEPYASLEPCGYCGAPLRQP